MSNDIIYGTPVVIGYYKQLQGDEYVESGDLVYVTGIRKEEDGSVIVSYVSGDRSLSVDIETFMGNTVHEPNGEAIRKQQMEDIGNEIQECDNQEIILNKKAANFLPHIADNGSFITSNDTDIVSARKTTPIAAKKAIATFKNDIAKLKNSVISKSEKLKSLAKEQQAIINAKVSALTANVKQKIGELQKVVAKAKDAIDTINLYLGKDEEIVTIRKGIKAPVDTPIVVRQLVLYMDEECLVAADDGGIDARQISNFDDWLIADPKHLQQVLPDQKGIVALRPRRTSRNYNDAWTNMRMAEANKQTYFLIRNGECLYRIWTDFDIGSSLIPDKDEFLDVFYEDDVSWRTNRRVEKPIVPGSKEYMRAMEILDSQKHHYFKVALILQGLLDRTNILKPLPVERLNILNPAEYGNCLRFIYDDGTGHLLSDGRPPYTEWLSNANRNICVGQRIIGNFAFTHGGRYSTDGDREHRLYPTSASLPSDTQLHTIEALGAKPGLYYFYYHRTDTIWRRDWYKESGTSKVRARCAVYQKDDFIINFDDPSVTIDTMEYYISSRLHRHNYINMVPLLRRAIAIKHAEIKEEKPFRDLLTSQIAMTYNVSHDVAREAVPELVNWWKFKNRTHRALLSDDQSALKMIISEFNIRRKRKLERTAIEDDQFVSIMIDMIHDRTPNVVFIGHKKANEYVALIAHNDENVFVTEQVWAINRSSSCHDSKRIRLKSSKEWKTVDKRWMRWKVLYKAERWNDWIVDSRSRGYLTDPERELMAIEAEKHIAKYEASYYAPIAISLYRNKSHVDYVSMFFCDTSAVLPTGLDSIRNRPQPPSISIAKFRYKRSGSGSIEVLPDYGGGYQSYISRLSFDISDKWWHVDYDGTCYSAHGTIKVLREWIDNYDDILMQSKLYEIWMQYYNRVDRAIRKAAENANDIIVKRINKLKYDEYIAEFGDPELWEEHRETLKIKYRRYNLLATLLAIVLETGVNCNGMTLQEVFDVAVPIRQAEDQKVRWGGWDDKTPTLHPDDADIVVEFELVSNLET